MNKDFTQELDRLSGQQNASSFSEDAQARILAAATQKIHAEQSGTGALHVAPRRRKSRRFAVPVIAAACVASLVIAAGASGYLGQLGVAGKNFWQNLFPSAAADTPDAQTAQALVQGNLMYDGQTVTLDGYTYTVINRIIDENGNGCLYYSVQNPNGIGQLYETYSSGGNKAATYCGILDTELGNRLQWAQLLLPDGTSLLCGRDYRDDERSTDTLWYIYSYFTVADAADFSQPMQFVVDRINLAVLPADQCAAIPGAQELVAAHPETDPYWEESKTIDLSGLTPVAAADTGTQGDLSVSLSSIGLTITSASGDHEKIEYSEALCHAIEFADGSRYVLRDESTDVRDCGYVCINDTMDTIRYVFRQIIDPADVVAVWVNGERIPVAQK